MKYEILTSDGYYHIYNRGNNKENIFVEEKNYYYFLKLVAKHILPVAEIHCYCLLPNHFHLLIRTKTKIENQKISQGFSNLFNAYSKAFNKMYKRTGSLFQRKFKRIKIKDEIYYKNLALYIHTNPQYHGITKNFETYLHSSYQAYISNKETKVYTHYLLSLFENKMNFKHAHHQKKSKIQNLPTLE